MRLSKKELAHTKNVGAQWKLVEVIKLESFIFVGVLVLLIPGRTAKYLGPYASKMVAL